MAPSTASFWTIINNVYDEASAALRMNLSYAHTHSSGSGSGGQLDWDVIWSDAVHDHSTATEGGSLNVSVIQNGVPLNLLTTLGDIPYATGSATWTRLAAGSNTYALISNGIGSAASWQALATLITSGSYSGNAGTDRAIAHSIGRAPKFVKIMDTNPGDIRFFSMGGTLYSETPTAFAYNLPTAPDSTNFYVGTASMPNSANGSGRTYDWVAFG